MLAMTSATAGYSGTPLHRKLGIKPGHLVLVRGAPPGWQLAQLDPEGSATVRARLPAGSTARTADVIVAFCPDAAALGRRLRELLPRLSQQGRLWICWPKRASGVVTDLDDAQVRRLGLAAGVVDVKVCAIDTTWSGLCFMVRLRDRS
jgi:hypothetical protein